MHASDLPPWRNPGENTVKTTDDHTVALDAKLRAMLAPRSA
jgi:hypothetical protein